jgi:two-component system, chemotaxis family, chemotaxis protein CheY
MTAPSHRRILVIDDAEHLRTVLELTLKFKGYEVVTAANGQEGLEAARAGAFDLVFCDIEMPVMNGIEFVKRFRSEVSRETPVLMLTAEGSELINQALAAGATSAFIKPFEPIRLLKEVEQRLG